MKSRSTSVVLNSHLVYLANKNAALSQLAQ